MRISNSSLKSVLEAVARPAQFSDFVIVDDKDVKSPGPSSGSPGQPSSSSTALAPPQLRMLRGVGKASGVRKPVRVMLAGNFGSISTDSNGRLGGYFAIQDVVSSVDWTTFKSVYDSVRVLGMHVTFHSIGPSVTNHIPFVTAFDVDNYGGSNLSAGNIASTVLRYTPEDKHQGVYYHHTRSLMSRRTLKFPLDKRRYATDAVIGTTNNLLVKPGEWVNVDNTSLINVGYLYFAGLVVGPSSSPLLAYTIFWDVEFANRS